MKYRDITLGRVEAVWNKLGGEDGVTCFLSGQLVLVSLEQVTRPAVLKIDRTKPFDPASFIGAGWTIWLGPKEGKGLKGEEEQDIRSLAITELDPTLLVKQTGLEGKETSVTGEEKRVRLILKAIQADAQIAVALLKEKGQTTLKWLEKTLSVTWIEFLGTTLRDSDGDRYALCLCREGGGLWGWGYDWLDDVRLAVSPALGFASAPLP